MPKLHRLLAELKRRHVYRVAAGYVVAAWLIIQVAATALPYLHSPEWLITTIIIVALAGFPVALVLAWLFEITPSGVHRDVDTSPTVPTPTRPTPIEPTPTGGGGVRIRPRWERLGPVLAGVAAVAVGGWLWSARADRGGPTSPVPFTGYDAIRLEHLQDSLQEGLKNLPTTIDSAMREATRAMAEHPDVPEPPPTPAVVVRPKTEGPAAVEDSIAAGRYRTISVLPFAPIGNAGLWRAAQDLADSLRAVVGRRSGLSAVSRGQVREALGEAGMSPNAAVDAEQAEKLQAVALGDIYIVGRLIFANGTTVVDAELRSTRDHALLRSTKIVRPGSEPDPQLARMLANELLGPAQ